LTANDLAVLADSLDAGADFHGGLARGFVPARRKHVNIVPVRQTGQGADVTIFRESARQSAMGRHGNWRRLCRRLGICG
jgi:hypothetical protein